MDYNNPDPKILNFMRALGQRESTNNPNVSSENSRKEGSIGRFQYLPETFKNQGEKYFKGKSLNGQPLNINDDSHQKLIKYAEIADLKSQGYRPDEIAAIHNMGMPNFIANNGYAKELGAKRDWKGTNIKGVNYNTIEHVQAVNDYYRQYNDQDKNKQLIEETDKNTIPYQPTERQQLISQGQPVSVNSEKTKPTIGGEIVRGLIKAPLSGALSIARGIASPFSKDIRENGLTVHSNYLGDTTDAVKGIENVAGQASQDFLQGQSLGKSVGKIIGKAGSTTLDTAGILPLEGVASTAGKGLIKNSLLQAGKIGGSYGAGYGLSGSLEQGSDFTDTVINTLTSGSLGLGLGVAGGVVGEGVSKVAKGISKKLEQNLVDRNIKALSKVNEVAPLRKVISKANERGINLEKIVAESNLLNNSVDKNGTIHTLGDGNAVDEYTRTFIDNNEKLVSSILRKENVSVSPDMVESYLKTKVKNSGINGEELINGLNKVEKEVAGYKLFVDDNGLVPLDVLHSAKVDKYSGINFMTDADVSKYKKTIAKGLKELVEDNTVNTDIKAINEDLSKHFTMVDYLKKLDGRKVEGGRLGKFVAKGIGAMVGGYFGPIGAIAGAELAGGIKGNQLSKTFKGKVVKPIEVGENIIKGQEYLKKPALQLQSSNKSGNLKAIQPKTNTIVINDNMPQLSNNLLKQSTKLSPEQQAAKYSQKIDKNWEMADRPNLTQGYKAYISKLQELRKTLAAEIKNNGNKGSIEAFKNTGNLTTKILKDLEGKTTVSKQYILDSTNRGELKQVERDITRQVLDTMPDGQINVKEFADKVKQELLPLKVKESPYPEHKSTKYESISLPDDLRGSVKNYKENVYESPIKTSAGRTHFSGIGKSGTDPENYFGHTRIEDMADNKTRRVIEVQSDLYQKGNLEKEASQYLRATDYLSPTDAKEYGILKRRRSLIEGAENESAYVDEIKQNDKRVAQLDKKAEQLKVKDAETKAPKIAKLQQYNDPTAHFRMIREEINKASQDGKTKLQFPTGETVMKIEGLGTYNNWRRGDFAYGHGKLEPTDLKVGAEVHQSGADDNWIITDVLGDGKFKAIPTNAPENGELFASPNDFIEFIKSGERMPEDLFHSVETFDISGKVDTNNPIYRFYEKDVQKYLNKFGGKQVVDDKGVSWIEIPITKEQGKAPVEAFGKTRVSTLGQMAGITAAGIGIANLYNKNKKQ